MDSTKTAPLANVYMGFDASTASIELRSSDPRLPSKGISISVKPNTESYKALFDLLTAEGIASFEEVDLPSNLRMAESAKELAPASAKDPRFNLVLGATIGNKPLEVDLSGHLLIVGAAGSGKSVVLRNVLCYGLENERVEIRAIDLKRLELGGYRYRPQDRIATSRSDAIALLQDLMEELNKRRAILTERGIQHYADTELPAIYLVVDELGELLGASSAPEAAFYRTQAAIARSAIEELLQQGRSLGIHLALGTQRADIASAAIRNSCATRILMARGDTATNELLFGGGARYDSSLFSVRGRGVIYSSSHPEQRLFQSYFIPYEAYRAPRDA